MITYFKRRFSSGDLQGDLADKREQEGLPSFLRFTTGTTFTGGLQQQQQPQQQLPTGPSEPNVEFMNPSVPASVKQPYPGGKMTYPSAPTSPSRSMSTAGGFTGGITGQISSTIMRGFSQAAQNISSARIPGASTVLGGGGAGGGQRQKVLLVIDDSSVDWSKYFKGRRLVNDWDIRVEQAQFNEISMTVYSEQSCLVNIHHPMEKHRTKPLRSFKPDFVLIRQHASEAAADWQPVLTGLMFGATACMNSLHAICNMKNRPWLFAHLQLVRNRIGKDKFPLVQQTYHSGAEEMVTIPNFPIVVKTGGGHHGEGKIRVDDANMYLDVANMITSMQTYATTEPLIDTKCDIHIQKIGSNYKAFARKSMCGNWKSNTGASMLERIQMTDTFKQWVDEVARMFGGLDICSVEVLQSKTGEYHIYDVNGSDLTLLGDSQDEDRRAVAEVVVQRMASLALQSTVPKTVSSQSIKNEDATHDTRQPASSMSTTMFSNQQQQQQQPPSLGQSSLPATPSISTMTARHMIPSTPVGMATSSSQQQQQQQQPPTRHPGFTPPAYRPTAPLSTVQFKAYDQPPVTTATSGLYGLTGPSPTGMSSTAFSQSTAPGRIGADSGPRPFEPSTVASTSTSSYNQPSPMGQSAPGKPFIPPRQTSLKSGEHQRAPPPPPPPPPAGQPTDDADDTMKNLRKTFAGIFGDM